MKVGIVTYCHCLNYGAELQSYALTHVVRRFGCDAEIINFDRVPVTSAQRRYLIIRGVLNRLKQHSIFGLFEILCLFQI